jgi:hypothetical protein
MSYPWADRVRQRGRLSVYIAMGVARVWDNILRNAIREFNVLSRSEMLGVFLTQTTVAPAVLGNGGADVSVATANGQISCTYESVTRTSHFDGSRIHGITLQYQIDNKIEKAFIFLPDAPMVNTPRGVRAVGAGVMKIIAVHEFVHACGLSNAEHSTDDLFQASPQVDPGITAAGDRVRIESGGNMRWMPPLVLSQTTARLIQRVWQTMASTGSERGALNRTYTRRYAANRAGSVMGAVAKFNEDVRGGTRQRSPLV